MQVHSDFGHGHARPGVCLQKPPFRLADRHSLSRSVCMCGWVDGWDTAKNITISCPMPYFTKSCRRIQSFQQSRGQNGMPFSAYLQVTLNATIASILFEVALSDTLEREAFPPEAFGIFRL